MAYSNIFVLLVNVKFDQGAIGRINNDKHKKT